MVVIGLKMAGFDEQILLIGRRLVKCPDEDILTSIFELTIGHFDPIKSIFQKSPLFKRQPSSFLGISGLAFRKFKIIIFGAHPTGSLKSIREYPCL